MATIKKVEPGDIEAVRNLVLKVIREELVADDEAADARQIMLRLFREARKYGLHQKDVVRAVCGPVWKGRTRGCNCPTCALRKERFVLTGQQANA